MAAQRALSYDLTPNPRTVFGCMMPAPWAGVAAGLLLAFGPQDGIPDRFSPLALALVHVLALGMLLPIMVGALFQMFPVIACQPVPGSRHIAPFVALSGILTALCLSIGFIGHHEQAFMLATVPAMFLLVSIGIALARGGQRVVTVDATTAAFRFIAVPFVLTLGFGVTLAAVFGGHLKLSSATLLPLHVGWALIGWIGTLIACVATTVVPMFWQIPKPHPLWQKSLPWALWLPLLVLTPITLLPGAPAQTSLWWLLPGVAVLGVAGVGFASLLRAQRRFDPGWPLWLCTALGWIVAVLLFAVQPLLPATLAAYVPWWIGVAVLVAGTVAPINAMLGKIIPFLVFLHLRRNLPPQAPVAPMHEIVLPSAKRIQANLLLLAIALLCAVPFAPAWLTLPAGLMFSASQAMLGTLVLKALLHFRRNLRNGKQAAASQP